jgi:hypothetical protein
LDAYLLLHSRACVYTPQLPDLLLVLQADAAVLHAVLSKEQSGTAASKHWLVPGALDVVELSLNSRLAYKCAPSMWLALAGCGHAVVSASFIAAAAQLVPLSAAAAAAASRLQTVFASAQQQLDASLDLPDPEKVDLLSTSHALYAEDCAGWLHQQFTRAAGEHRQCVLLAPFLPAACLGTKLYVHGPD